MSGTIIVTGATGFVGRHLVRALENQPFEVRPCSLRDPLPNLPIGAVSHVFHLAAKTYVPESWCEPLPFYEANVLGTAKILEFCRRVRAAFTLVSSYVYGKPESLPISEGHALRAFNPYSHTKLLAEEISRYYADTFDVSVTVVRPFNLYGPGQDVRFLVPTIIRQALDPSSQAIVVANDQPRRDFLFVGDFVDLLIGTLNPLPDSFAVFNAGSGVSISVSELCKLVKKHVGAVKPVISRGESRPDEVMDVVADISQARRQFAWRPRTSMEDGLRLTISAYRGMAEPQVR